MRTQKYWGDQNIALYFPILQLHLNSYRKVYGNVWRAESGTLRNRLAEDT